MSALSWSSKIRDGGVEMGDKFKLIVLSNDMIMERGQGRNICRFRSTMLRGFELGGRDLISSMTCGNILGSYN